MENFKKVMKEYSEAMQNVAENLADSMKNLKLDENLKNVAENLTNSIKNIDLKEYNKALESVLPQIVMFNRSMIDTILGVIKGTQENINTMNENMIALFEKMKTFHPKESDN